MSETPESPPNPEPEQTSANDEGSAFVPKLLLLLLVLGGLGAGAWQVYSQLSYEGRRARAFERLGREEIVPFVRDQLPKLLPQDWNPEEGWTPERQAPLKAAISTGNLGLEVNHHDPELQKLDLVAAVNDAQGTLPTQLIELAIFPLVATPKHVLPPPLDPGAAPPLDPSNASADRGAALVFYTDYGNLFRDRVEDFEGFPETFVLEGVSYTPRRSVSSLPTHLTGYAEVQGPEGTPYRVYFKWTYDEASLLR